MKLNHRKLVRKNKVAERVKNDKKLFDICSKNPKAIFSTIKASKTNSQSKIQRLHVGDKTYLESEVPDGFYDSLSTLKSLDCTLPENSPTSPSFSTDYENIIHICSQGPSLPKISLQKAFKILKNIKPHVTDLYSITALHYLNAGPGGLIHFYRLLNALIQNLNNISIDNLNAAYAIVLYKGHKKDKYSDRSYRTISTCPFLAKCLDVYVRDLNLEAWNHDQADTQFQGEGLSHECASLLLTECIQHSLHSTNQPVFALYLDAKSAFDVVLRHLLVKNLYFCGTSDASIIFINNRLKSRTTYLDWDKTIMGPIVDERGLEQGGVSSSDFYKVFAKEQIQSAQVSEMGVDMRHTVVSAIGQADDTVLLSNNIHDLQNLLHLTLNFCSKYHVELCAEKTKLQAYCTKKTSLITQYQKDISPIKISNTLIPFVDSAEHVGIIRSTTSNLPAILRRIVSPWEPSSCCQT